MTLNKYAVGKSWLMNWFAKAVRPQGCRFRIPAHCSITSDWRFTVGKDNLVVNLSSKDNVDTLVLNFYWDTMSHWHRKKWKKENVSLLLGDEETYMWTSVSATVGCFCLHRYKLQVFCCKFYLCFLPLHCYSKSLAGASLNTNLVFTVHRDKYPQFCLKTPGVRLHWFFPVNLVKRLLEPVEEKKFIWKQNLKGQFSWEAQLL